MEIPWRGFQKHFFLKETMTLNQNVQSGGVVQTKNLLWGVWIFSQTKQIDQC